MQKKKKSFLSLASFGLMIGSLLLQNCENTVAKKEETIANKVAITDVTGKVSKNISNDSLLTSDNAGTIHPQTLVDVIIELKDDSLLDKYATSSSVLSLTDFANLSSNVNYATSLISKQNRAYETLSADVYMHKKYNYTTILNGFAATVKYGDISALEKNALVKNLIISEVYEKPDVTSLGAYLPGVTENDVNVYDTGIYDTSNLPYDGSGTIVAILDTGLDYTHSAFQIQPTGKLAVDKDKVDSIVNLTQASIMSANKENNAFTLTGDQLWISSKVPFAYDYADVDADVYPLEDHGTHVAGILAGQDDEITGVATNAQLAIMKVFSDSGEGAGQDGILAALNDCVLLGVDVINMSLGSSCGFAREEDDDDVNEIYDAIQEAGISLVVAASNDYSAAKGSELGDTNLLSNPDSGTIGSPSSYHAAYSVASISGVKTSYGVANNETVVYFTESSKNATTKNNFIDDLLGIKESETFEYVTIYGTGVSSDYMGLDVKGKIALVRRGVETFENKIKTAEAKGAAAVIIYNNISGEISMSVGKDVTIPSCSISMDIGNILAQRDTGTIEFSKSYKAGPFMSGFSSWGTLPDLELKPDITAHGGEIYSAVRGGYDTVSGTSMACPNMAGATLLVRQYIKDNFKEMNSKEIAAFAQQLTMSTATIALNEDGNPYSPRKQGAGLADILKATTTNAYLWVDGSDKTKISLGDDAKKEGLYQFTFNLTNFASFAQTFEVQPYVFTESVSSDGKTVAEKAYMFEDAEVSFSLSHGSLSGNETMITVPGYDTIKITTTIQLSAKNKQYLDQYFTNGMYVEGFIQLLNRSVSGFDLTIPYCGFYGDWTVAPMFDYTAYEIAESLMDDSIRDDDKLKAQAYGTIPMGGFSYSNGEVGSWGLGNYGYTLADGYDKPEPEERFAALSLNPDAQFILTYVAAGLLRNAKQVNIVITNNETGAVIYDDIYYDARKSHYSSGRTPGVIDIQFNPSDYGLKNNTSYTLSLEAFLDWDGEQHNLKNTFSSTFTIDSQAPIYQESVVRIRTDSDKNNRYYLDMYVYDNQYIQCYTIGTYGSLNADGTVSNYQSLMDYTIPVVSAADTTNRITLEITDYMEQIAEADGKLYVEFIDYAKNTSNYTIQLPQVDAESIEITAPTNEDQEVVVRQNAIYDLYKHVTLQPETAWYERLIWESDDETIASVYQGEIFGINPGVTTIRAISQKDAEIYKEITVRVIASTSSVPTLSNLKLNKTTLNLDQGESYTLKVTLEPWTLTEEYIRDHVSLIWSSNNESIASVEVNPDNPLEATVKARYEGTALITVQSGPIITNTCRVTVKEMFEVEGSVLKKYHGRGDENGVVEIPDDLGIVYIYQTAFYDNDYITKIIVPEGVEEIQYAGIYGNENLREVVLPITCHTLNDFSLAWNPKLEKVNLENVTTIFKRAFIMDYALWDIDLSNVRSIGMYAFYNCTSLTSIDLSNCGNVGQLAFAYNTSLREIKMTENTTLGVASFYRCTSLTSLVIPTTSVGYQTFYSCTGLKEVIFTNDMTLIDSYAFYNCSSLENVTFKGNVETINSYAFAYNTSLQSITLPNGLTKLGELAFGEDKALATIKIPAGCELQTIERAVFGDVTLLSGFIVEEGNPYLVANDGILYDRSMTTLLLVPQKKNLRNFTVPSTVLEIGDYAFSYCSALTSIDLQNVRLIGEGAFYSCTFLTSYTTGQVEEIKTVAFYNCTSLRQIALPSSLRIIGDSAFFNCTSSTIKYELIIPAGVEEIGFNAFRRVQGIQSVTFENEMDYLPGQIFAECTYLTTISWPLNLQEIGEYAFYKCTSLTEITLPDTVMILNTSVFGGCTGLSKVELPSSISSIPENAYRDCTGLVDIVIPETIDYIGPYAFYGCKNLLTVDFANTTTIDAYAFVGTKLTDVASEKVRAIGAYAFSNNTALVSAIFPNVLYVNSAAFANDSKLIDVDFSSVLQIGSGAFYNTASLREIQIDRAQLIGAQAFMNSSLETVSMASVVLIYPQAFAMTNLQEIVLPSSVEQIGMQAFAYIDTLTSIRVASDNPIYFAADQVLYSKLPNGFYELHTYPNGKTDSTYEILARTARINDAAFGGNAYLETVILPASLKSIGQGAFLEASALRKVIFRSVAAPILESVYDANNQLTYNNFIASINNGKTLLDIEVPSNGVGYHTHVYETYFDVNRYTVGEAQPDADVLTFLYALEDIDLNEVLSGDRALADYLENLYASVASNMRGYISDEAMEKYQAILNKIGLIQA